MFFCLHSDFLPFERIFLTFVHVVYSVVSVPSSVFFVLMVFEPERERGPLLDR